jgi:hypothetical protein
MSGKAWIEQQKEDSNTSSWESSQEHTPLKTGRPKKDPKDKRKPRFNINLSDDEFSLITEAAEELGVPVATFVRQQALKKAKGILD